MKSYVFLADGFEEIEALSTVDVMRRAGMEVVTVSIYDRYTVTGAHGVPVDADEIFEDVDFTGAEWLIAPGGLPGAKYLSEYKPLSELLRAHAKSGKVAAICAAPAMVLAPLGILDGKHATGYPGTEDLAPNAIMTGAMVEVDGNVVTAKGPAAAAEFALAIVAISLGQATADNVAKGMLLK